MHDAAVPEAFQVFVPEAPEQEELCLARESVERVWVSTQLVAGCHAKFWQRSFVFEFKRFDERHRASIDTARIRNCVSPQLFRQRWPPAVRHLRETVEVQCLNQIGGRTPNLGRKVWIVAQAAQSSVREGFLHPSDAVVRAAKALLRMKGQLTDVVTKRGSQIGGDAQ